MICPNCSSSVAEDQEFCGKCGHHIRETVATLNERLSKAETRLSARSDGKEQKYLESEAVENVMNRVKSWTTLFLYFAGVPLAILALAFAVIFGKGDIDLHSIAANAKQSVGAVLAEAQSVASGAQKTANDARTTSQQVSEDIKTTQRRVAELKTQVDSRLAEAQKLEARIKESESSVAALTAKVNSQTQQVTHLAQQVKTVETDKSITDVKSLNPGLYGEHMVFDYRGHPIGVKDKGTDVRIVFTLDQDRSSPSPLDPAKTATALQVIKEHHYEIFLGGVYLQASVAGGSAENIAWLNSESCSQGGPALSRPCIVYYSDAMKTKASELRTLLSSVQQVPASQVRYVPLSRLSAREQELIQKSGVDILVALGQ
jgi:TolA-binding protein